MQATLSFTARPVAVRRAAAQTSSRRNAIVVRAEKKEATRYVHHEKILILSTEPRSVDLEGQWMSLWRVDGG
jgi:uncharacterized protein (DUF1778 family)